MQEGLSIVLHLCAISQISGLLLTPRCDADWETFGKGRLNKTARIEQTRGSFIRFRTYSDHRYGMQGVFVHPDSKFAFCLIEKNGCSVLSKAFNTLLPEGHRADPYYQVSQVSQNLYGRRGLRKVFRDPKATRAVFVRDPMVRFVSAFVNKCIEGTDIYKPFSTCPMYKPGGTVFRDAVEYAVRHEFTDAHWRAQSLHCDLKQRLHQYTVIGVMKPHTFSRDVSCVLQQAGLDRISQIEHSNVSPRHGLTEEDILKRFFTPDAARRLIYRYREDYDLFGFVAEPAWIAHATGEWYDKNPKLGDLISTSSNRSGGLDFFGSPDSHDHLANKTDHHGDQDHIVTLAVRAGFLD